MHAGMPCLRWMVVIVALSATAHADSRVTRVEAARLGAQRNLALLAARLAGERAALQADAARRDFVPTLELRGEYDDGAATVREARDRAVSYRGTVSWPTPLGTVVGAEATSRESTSGAPLLDDTADVALTLKQPLLEGFGRDATPLDEADLDARIERERFRQALEDLLAEIDAAYWDLAFAQADVAVKTRSRARAQQQFEDTRENIRRGILAEGEIYVVEENLVFFEQQLREAGERLVLAQRRLARLLQLEPSVAITASDAPSFGATLQTPDAAAHDALVGNPRLAAAGLEVDRQRARAAREADRALPRLDLDGRLGLAGAGEPGDAWAEIGRGDRVDGRLGLTFAVPLSPGPERAAAEAARVEERRLAAERDRVRNEVDFAARDLLTRLHSLRERLDLARRRVELAELKLQAENQKYAAGLSTLTDVVRFQRDVDEATIGLDQLQRDLLTLHSRLLATQGALQEMFGVEVK